MLDKDCFSSESDRPGLMKNIGGALVPEAMPQFSVSDCRVLPISILYALHSRNSLPGEITKSDWDNARF